MNTWNPTTYPLSQLEEDDLLTHGVLSRRFFGWLVDMALIAVILSLSWVLLFTFGIMTLGLGMPLLGLLPLGPFLYNFGFLAGTGATPGQKLFGLEVRQNNDLEPPTGLQALLSTLAYYVTLATSGLLLLVAFITSRKRTLHDLVSGLVVVRSAALTPGSGYWNMRGGSPYA